MLYQILILIITSNKIRTELNVTIDENGDHRVDLDSNKFDSYKYLESEENNNDIIQDTIRMKKGEFVCDF